MGTYALEGNKQTYINFVTFIDPPYIFDTHEAQGKGLVETIIQTLMSHANIDYTIQLMPAKRAELYAKSTQNTCVFPIEKSQEREVFFSWVSPIIVSKQGFFSNPKQSSESLQVLEDAKPYRIGSYLGSGIGEYLASLGYQVDFATKNEANIYKLEANRIDLWASDILTAEYISTHSGIEITPSKLDFFTTLRAIGCHPSVPESVIKSMHEELQMMYKNGHIYHIVQDFKANLFSKDRFSEK
jgi:polar amino acid transport system substrate-binding protein